ncbi:MAG: phosphonate ABC transporter ATP-binding protein [Planctomycetota bacterium]|nr:MAG: phosphonate ABC transporter ATP-binding protein [Planctomycetota bacterium]
MLSFKGLRKIYPDGTVALDTVDLTVPNGQFCVILGPSGSGKSTLLRTINGLVDPTAGTITLRDLPLERRTMRQFRRQVGTIHQSFNITGRLSVLANVCAGACGDLPAWRSSLGIFPTPLKRKACQLIARVGLQEKHLYRRAKELSGGQQQRVGIARAFILDQPVILADEPVASLDPETSREILTLLREASRERHATVLCSLHQIDLAREFADRIVGVSCGNIVFDGLPGELDDAALKRIYQGQPDVLAEAGVETVTAKPSPSALEPCRA